MIEKHHRKIDYLVPHFHSPESRLRATLLESYVTEARPVINTTTMTIVDVGLTIIQVMDLVRRIYCIDASHQRQLVFHTG